MVLGKQNNRTMIQMETFDDLGDFKDAVATLAEASSVENIESSFTRACYRTDSTAFYVERVNDTTLQVEVSTKKPTDTELPSELQDIESEIWSSISGTDFEQEDINLNYWRDFQTGAEFKNRITAC